jgi:hypothetical protein
VCPTICAIASLEIAIRPSDDETAWLASTPGLDRMAKPAVAR